MPPIKQSYLACSAYFYPSEQAAREGKSVGGSGFVVGIPVEGHEGWSSLYLLTNKHVLDAGGRYVRLATVDGGVDIIETERDSWVDHKDRYDVSALEIDLAGKPIQLSYIPTSRFMTHELLENWQIAVGDEAFLVGRLITPWGQQRNNPAVRFGNISMMADPNELIIGYGNVEQEAFLVECRSLSGFSGSPVFCSTTRSYPWDEKLPKEFENLPRQTPNRGFSLPAPFGTFGPWLLGIDMSHLPLWKPVYESRNFDDPKTDHWVEQNTGIACVLPAWHTLDLLNVDVFVEEREKGKRELDERKNQQGVLDLAIEDPLTKSGFEDVLGRVSGKSKDSVPEPESEKKQTSG